eukprot:140995-Alexandrium_andersonii.AAC.1
MPGGERAATVRGVPRSWCSGRKVHAGARSARARSTTAPLEELTQGDRRRSGARARGASSQKHSACSGELPSLSAGGGSRRHCSV